MGLHVSVLTTSDVVLAHDAVLTDEIARGRSYPGAATGVVISGLVVAVLSHVNEHPAGFCFAPTAFGGIVFGFRRWMWVLPTIGRLTPTSAWPHNRRFSQRRRRSAAPTPPPHLPKVYSRADNRGY